MLNNSSDRCEKIEYCIMNTSKDRILITSLLVRDPNGDLWQSKKPIEINQ